MNEAKNNEREKGGGKEEGGGGGIFRGCLDGSKKVREGRGEDLLPCMQTRLPNRERAERPSHRHAVDDDVIHGQYVLAFDREHDSAFVRRYHGERRTGEDGGGGGGGEKERGNWETTTGVDECAARHRVRSGQESSEGSKDGEHRERDRRNNDVRARGGRSHQNV